MILYCKRCARLAAAAVAATTTGILLGVWGSDAALPPASAQVQLLTNGDFETGGFQGWIINQHTSPTRYDETALLPAMGSFVVIDGVVTPISGLSALGPSQGSFYAVSDMNAAGSRLLLQEFTVPFDATVVNLSFDMYVYDWYGAGAAIDPSGLDRSTPNPNQHARVDLVVPGGDTFTTSAARIVQNYYIGVDPEAQAGQAPFYRSYSFDLTGIALPGQTYWLRFGEVDNQFVLHQAVDNVSITAVSPSAAAAPEPGTGALLLLAAGGSVLAARCRRRGRS